MHEILAKVQEFLSNVQEGKSNIPSELLDKIQQGVRHSLERHYNDPKKDRFTLRMSNVGRPLCQLQQEMAGKVGLPDGYNAPMRNSFGDVIEAMAIAIMMAAGVNVRSYFGECFLEIGGIKLKGHYDVIIETNGREKVYDVKSCSSYAFNHKFGIEGGFYNLVDDDAFGYLTQGYLYAEALKLPFGGWIAINKETGEWAVCEPPENDAKYRKMALEVAERNIISLTQNLPFAKLFEDKEETFYKKATGNRVLHNTCSYCEYQQDCWPTLQILRDVNTTAKSAKMKHYTYVAPKQ